MKARAVDVIERVFRSYEDESSLEPIDGAQGVLVALERAGFRVDERLEGTEPRERELMVEGYRESAEADLEFARASLPGWLTLEGTEPLTDGETVALEAVLSLLKIEGPLGAVHWPDFESARAKLRARLAKRDEE